MSTGISARLASAVNALPLTAGLRVLEIGCGPGVATRAAARIVAPGGVVVGIDRSAVAIRQAVRGSRAEIASGTAEFRHSSIEEFAVRDDEKLFDLAFAIRVGALDGRHPGVFERAMEVIRSVVVPDGSLWIDGCDPLRRVEFA